LFALAKYSRPAGFRPALAFSYRSSIMSYHYSNEEQESIRLTVKRRVDLETGQLRDQSTTDRHITDVYADPLSQCEDFLNDAETEAEPGAEEGSGVEDETGGLREDLQRLQAEFVSYPHRVERDRDVAKDNARSAMLEALLPVIDDI